MTIHLGRSLPNASRNLPGQQREDAPAANRASSLFGFAPGGVYHASAVTLGAVRSYRTLSPLPTQKRRRFAFCGTFPRVTPAGRYPAPYPRGARTFLPQHLSDSFARSSNRLAERTLYKSEHRGNSAACFHDPAAINERCRNAAETRIRRIEVLQLIADFDSKRLHRCRERAVRSTDGQSPIPAPPDRAQSKQLARVFFAAQVRHRNAPTTFRAGISCAPRTP